MYHTKAYNAPVTFREVAACFSEDEWKLLHEWQKELYRNLMREIHKALISLGPAIAASVFSLRAEEFEDECYVDNRIPERGNADTHPPGNGVTKVMSASFKDEEKAHLVRHQESKEMQNQRCSTGSPSLTFEVSCVDPMDAEQSEGSMSPENDVTEVMFSAIKEEKEADSPGYPDLTEVQSMSWPTDNITSVAGVESLVKEDNATYSTTHKGQMVKESVPDFSDIAAMFGPEFLKGYSTEQQHAVIQGNHNPIAYQSYTDSRNKNKVYRCSACNKQFTSDSDVMQGMNSKAAQYCCAACEQCFTNKEPLTVHQAPPSGPKLFACTECKKSFRQKKNLSRHRLIHSGVKPFSCNECEKRFTQKAHLLIHQRIHSGEKPFSCTECGRGFTQKTNLMYHQRTHSGVRLFSCTECAKTFNRKDSLLHHQSMHS